MIELQHVTKIFRDLTVLDDVSFIIEPGEFVCLTGPSGAGKSTLLSLFVGAQEIESGSIRIDDVDLQRVPSHELQLFRRRVGMVFQDYKLLGNRTVAENIAFPLEVIGATDDEIESRVRELLVRLDMEKRATARTWELSGGEKARVAIARAIVHKPLIVLADEPTGNLDAQQANSVLHLLQEIHGEGTTVILATHDMSIVNSLRTRLLTLDHGRLIRDSAGKIAERTSETHKVVTSEEQEGSAASPVAITDEDEEPKKKKRAAAKAKADEAEDASQKRGSAGGQRKVRITSIHSDERE